MLLERDRNKLRVLALHLRKFPGKATKFHFHVEGDFGKKRSQRAKQVANEVRSCLSAQAAEWNWECVSRAGVAVTMTFFPGSRPVPDVHNLVKFYLDLLQGVVFRDDRQVRYLMAECYRKPELPEHVGPTLDLNDGGAQKARYQPAQLYITVERMTDLTRRLRAHRDLERFSELQSLVRRELGDPERELEDVLEDLHVLPPRLLKELGMTDEQARQHHDWERRRRRERLLELSVLNDAMEQPISPTYFGRGPLFYPDFFSVQAGKLPGKGQSGEYERQLRASVRRLLGAFDAKLDFRVSLDVQVATRAPHLLSKDLDNVMRDVCPIIREEVVAGSGHVHGYRIYTVKAEQEQDEGMLRVKLLPGGAFHEAEARQDKIAELARRWIEQQLAHSW